MSMLGFRRVVYWLQWFAVFIIPIVTVSLSSGWEAFLAVPVAFVGFLAMLSTAIISVTAKDLRATLTVPRMYAILSVILWVVSIFFPLALEHSGDSDSTPSALEQAGLSQSLDGAVVSIVLVLSVGLWIAAFAVLLARKRDLPVPVAVPVPVPSAAAE